LRRASGSLAVLLVALQAKSLPAPVRQANTPNER
jgi:hypothetical protein